MKHTYELGSIVKAGRKRKRLSQEALAEKIGVCKRTIVDIENDTGNPKFDLLCQLVRELELPLYQVFYPEAQANFELKNVLVQELDACSERELRVLETVVRGLRETRSNNG